MKIFQDLSELLNSMCEISALLLGSLIKASLILDHPSDFVHRKYYKKE